MRSLHFTNPGSYARALASLRYTDLCCLYLKKKRRVRYVLPAYPISTLHFSKAHSLRAVAVSPVIVTPDNRGVSLSDTLATDRVIRQLKALYTP